MPVCRDPVIVPSFRIASEAYPPGSLRMLLISLQTKLIKAYKFRGYFNISGSGTNWTVDVSVTKMGKKLCPDVAAFESSTQIRELDGVKRNVASLEITDTPKGVLLTIALKESALHP